MCVATEVVVAYVTFDVSTKIASKNNGVSSYASAYDSTVIASPASSTPEDGKLNLIYVLVSVKNTLIMLNPCSVASPVYKQLISASP